MGEILGGLLVGCVMSGVVPLVNAEVLVVAAALAVPASGLPLVVVSATVGQMLSKTLLFGLARHAPRRLPARARRVLDRATETVRSRGGAAGSLVFASAAVGIPPFYGVSLAGGVLGLSTRTFVLTGTGGRALRFGLLAAAAHTVGAAGGDLSFAALVDILLSGGVP